MLFDNHTDIPPWMCWVFVINVHTKEYSSSASCPSIFQTNLHHQHLSCCLCYVCLSVWWCLLNSCSGSSYQDAFMPLNSSPLSFLFCRCWWPLLCWRQWALVRWLELTPKGNRPIKKIVMDKKDKGMCVQEGKSTKRTSSSSAYYDILHFVNKLWHWHWVWD